MSTGDVGEMCADGVLRIIDRKKDLVKLSGGQCSRGPSTKALLSLYIYVFIYIDTAHKCAWSQESEAAWRSGEYVSLGKVEANLKSVKGLAACSVFAQGDKDHCVVSALVFFELAPSSSLECTTPSCQLLGNADFPLWTLQVIVSQPEKGWGSVGGKPDEGALLKDILAAMTVLVKGEFCRADQSFSDFRVAFPR